MAEKHTYITAWLIYMYIYLSPQWISIVLITRLCALLSVARGSLANGVVGGVDWLYKHYPPPQPLHVAQRHHICIS